MSTRDTQTADGSPNATEIVHRTTHEDDGEPLSTAVALAICEAAGVDPIDFQLYQYVDPDSLDSLFAPVESTERECGRVELYVLGYRISVTSSGEITIRPTGSEASSASESE